MCGVVLQCDGVYLEGGLLSVVEQHEDGHLEGGHLQDVLPGVGASHLSSAHSHLRPILLFIITRTG